MEIAIGLLVLALVLLVLSGRLRAQSGLPEGQVVYSDTGAWTRNERVLVSKRHGLSGKPDYLIKTRQEVIPVELKSGPAPRAPRPGHVLQLGAYCLLVEDVMRETVRRGVIRYDDEQFELEFDAALRTSVLDTLADMRADLAAGGAERSHADARRCRSCGVRQACDEALSDT
jgi:CRISPR-associated exonuclease Cas4